MSFHPQQTLLSLGYHGSFCTTLEWIGVQKVFILMYLKKYHQNVRNLHPKTSLVKVKTATWTIRVLSPLNVINIWGVPKMSRAQKLNLFIGVKTFMQTAKKGYAFLSMFFPHQMLNHLIMKFLFSVRYSRMCLKRIMLTLYWNVVHMIGPLILKREHNFHSTKSITYHKMNVQLFMSTSMKTLKKGSFDIQSLQLVPWSYCLVMTFFILQNKII